MGKGRGRGKKIGKQVPRSQRMSAYDRLQWCRRQWLDDPSIPIQGPNGMIRLMKGAFGVAASYQILYKLHDGVQKDLAERYRIEQEREALDHPRKREPFNPSLRLTQIKNLAKEPRAIPSADVQTTDSPPLTKYVVPDPAPTPEPKAAPKPAPQPALRVVVPRKRAKRADFAARELFAMNQLRQRPHMPMTGPDGLNELIRSRFGRGMSHITLKQLKLQILAELETPETLQSIMSAMPEKNDEPPKESSPVDAEAALRTAAELIQESIPNLQEFVLTVDDDGKTHVSYKQHIVKTGEFVLDG